MRPGEVISGLRDRLRQSSYWRDVGWLASGRAASQVMAVAAMPVFSRLFVPGDFAVHGLFQQVMGLAMVFAAFRFELLVQMATTDSEALGVVRVVKVCAAVFVVTLTPFLWWQRAELSGFMGERMIAPWLALLPVSAAFFTLARAEDGYAQRIRAFRSSGEANAAGRLTSIGMTLAGWIALPGAGGLVAGVISGPVGKVGWLRWRSKRPAQLAQGDAWRVARRLFPMARALALSHAILAVTSTLPFVFIGRTYGSDSLGQYSLAFQMVALPAALIGESIGSVYYQRVAERWSQGSGFRDIWQATAKRLAMIGLPVFTIAVVCAPWLFPLVFGGAWIEGGRYAMVLAAGAGCSFVMATLNFGTIVAAQVRWYLPCWHSARLLTLGVVFAIAHETELSLMSFLILKAVGEFLMYGITFYSQYRFSGRTPGGLPA